MMKLSTIDFLSGLADLKTAITSVLLSLGTGFGTWVYVRRKQNAETKSMEQEIHKVQLKTSFESFESFQTQLRMVFLELKENQKELSGALQRNREQEKTLIRLQIEMERYKVWSCSDGACTDRVEYKTE